MQRPIKITFGERASPVRGLSSQAKECGLVFLKRMARSVELPFGPLEALTAARARSMRERNSAALLALKSSFVIGERPGEKAWRLWGFSREL